MTLAKHIFVNCKNNKNRKIYTPFVKKRYKILNIIVAESTENVNHVTRQKLDFAYAS